MNAKKQILDSVSLLVLNLSHKMGLEDNETRKSQRENQ